MRYDLLLVVPDKGIEQTFHGLLARPEALGIRPVTYDVRVHPGRDPGCYKTAHELAATSVSEARHVLVVFDLAWDGAPGDDPQALEADVVARLHDTWGKRGRCVVIAPELEAWVWSDSPHVPKALGWRGTSAELREWLEAQDLWPPGQPKPPDPKAAFERALWKVRLPPASSIFRQLAERVGLRACQDAAFGRVVAILQEWFGQAGR